MFQQVGCDISEAMIMYAQKKYGNNQFSFKQLDISNSNIWMNWEEGIFDKIFSFYCLHWVTDQRYAYKDFFIIKYFNVFNSFKILKSIYFLLLDKQLKI